MEAASAEQSGSLQQKTSAAHIARSSVLFSMTTRITAIALANIITWVKIASALCIEREDSSAKTPEQLLDRKQTDGLIIAAIDRLPENYRIVLLLRDIGEMSTTGAAEVLEMTESKVKVSPHRARAMRAYFDFALRHFQYLSGPGRAHFSDVSQQQNNTIIFR